MLKIMVKRRGKVKKKVNLSNIYSIEESCLNALPIFRDQTPIEMDMTNMTYKMKYSLLYDLTDYYRVLEIYA